MRLLEWLFGKPDATKHWRPAADLKLEIDFSRHALAGVGIGDPIGGLAPVGPAEKCERGRGENYYRYHSKGFEFAESEGRVVFFGFTFLSDYGDGFDAFRGGSKWADRSLGFSAMTTEAEIVDALGQPYWRDEDEDEITLFYEFPRQSVEWQLELSKEGTLKFLMMTTPPLLSEETAREAFGVTKPWPPLAAPAG